MRRHRNAFIRMGAFATTAGLAVILGLHGCSSSTPSTTRRAYEGEALFQGMVFGTGPAAREFPEIWQRAETRCLAQVRNSKEAARIRERLTSRVHADNSQFLRTFAVEMQSGDHLRVRAALDRAGEMTRNAVALEFSIKPESVTFEEGLRTNAGIQVTTVIHKYAAIAEVRYLWVWFDFWWPDPKAGPQAPQLSRDVLVDLVVKRLTAPANQYSPRDGA